MHKKCFDFSRANLEGDIQRDMDEGKLYMTTYADLIDKTNSYFWKLHSIKYDNTFFMAG